MPGFYMHEDDWGMISLLPAENATWARGVAEEAQRASQENFAGYVEVGEGRIPVYKSVHVIPEEKHPISERAIRLEDLGALLLGGWPQADKVETGYSSHAEELKGAFAFGKAYDEAGAFYGSRSKDGIVTRLYITRPHSDDAQALEMFGAALERLGRRYGLVLADWWTDTAVDLRDPTSIREYLAAER
jgi:hypothetical protein